MFFNASAKGRVCMEGFSTSMEGIRVYCMCVSNCPYGLLKRNCLMN